MKSCSVAYCSFLRPASGSEFFDTFTNIFLLIIFPLQNIYSWKLPRKIKWQIPGEPLAARYNWYQGPVPGRGPAVEKHCSRGWLGITRRRLWLRQLEWSFFEFGHEPSAIVESFLYVRWDLGSCGIYAAYIGSQLMTFRAKTSVPSSRVKHQLTKGDVFTS